MYLITTFQLARTSGDLLIAVLSVLSAALQLVYVVRLVQSLHFITLTILDTALYDWGDPKLLAGAFSQVLMTLTLGAIVGLVGAAFAWHVLRDKKFRPQWFVALSRVFAFGWLLFFPIGTILGFYMLRWREPDSDTRLAT